MFRQLKTLIDKCGSILEAAKSKNVMYNKSVEETLKVYKKIVLMGQKSGKIEIERDIFETYQEFLESNINDMIISNDWYKGAVFYPGGDDSNTDKCLKLNDFHDLCGVIDTSGRMTTGLETTTLRFFIEIGTHSKCIDQEQITKLKEYLSELEDSLKSSKPVSGTKALKDISQQLSSGSGLEGIGEIFKNKELLKNLMGGVTSMMNQPELKEQLNEMAKTAGLIAPPAPLQAPVPVAAPQVEQMVPVTDDM